MRADLVWIGATTQPAGDRKTAAAILQCIMRLHFEALSAPSARPVLIVTTMRGSEHEVAAPFTSGLNESQTHVPLWIEHGAGHACRIQALTGSFDLLPTLAEYLTGENQAPEAVASIDENLPDGSLQLSGKPMSLVRACEHYKKLPDRLLRLTGDSWIALRTEQYLLVHSRSLEKTADAPDQLSDEEVTAPRRLYLKPDDVWNANDAIVAYAEIADQMEAAAKLSEQGPD